MQEINQDIIDNFFSNNICKCGTRYEYHRYSKIAKLCPKCYSNSWIEYTSNLKYPKFKESDFYVTREATKPFPNCKGFPRSQFGFVWITKSQANRIPWDTSRSEMFDHPHFVFVPTEPKPKCEIEPTTIILLSIFFIIFIYEFLLKG